MIGQESQAGTRRWGVERGWEQSCYPGNRGTQSSERFSEPSQRPENWPRWGTHTLRGGNKGSSDSVAIRESREDSRYLQRWEIIIKHPQVADRKEPKFPCPRHSKQEALTKLSWSGCELEFYHTEDGCWSNVRKPKWTSVGCPTAFTPLSHSKDC